MNTKDIEEMVWEIAEEASNLIDGAGTTEEVQKVARRILTTLTKHHEAEVQRAYERGVADGTDKPLLAIENVREAERERERERIKKEFERLAHWTENAIETPEGSIDGSFYTIYRGHWEKALTPTKTDKQ